MFRVFERNLITCQFTHSVHFYQFLIVKWEYFLSVLNKRRLCASTMENWKGASTSPIDFSHCGSRYHGLISKTSKTVSFLIRCSDISQSSRWSATWGCRWMVKVFRPGIFVARTRQHVSQLGPPGSGQLSCKVRIRLMRGGKSVREKSAIVSVWLKRKVFFWKRISMASKYLVHC